MTMQTQTLTAPEIGAAAARGAMARRPAASLAWNYETGLLLLALWRWSEAGACPAALGADCRNYVRTALDGLIGADGTIAGYREDEYNLDQVNGGKILLAAGAAGADGAAERLRRAAARLRDQLRRQPRTASGGFWHKQKYPRQIWLDGLYMQAPFAAAWGLANGEPDLVDDACVQLAAAAERTRDPVSGLLRHAWDESRQQLWADPATGRSPQAWGRALGWYAMALVDVLEPLPPDHPRLPALRGVLDGLWPAVAAARDGGTGLWFQVLDQAGRPGNYPEASASAMFCYAFAKSVRLGYAPAAPYRAAAAEAFAALAARYFTVDAAGAGSLAGICKVAGLGGDPYRDGSYAYYVGEPVVADDIKGVGPLILAAAELAR
jgi:unsaturated rhamnogalacturonyl hydrolase